MRLVRKLYDWTLRWAESPHASMALFLLALIESSFFIVPPDLLLIALCAGAPKRSFRFALICSAGSVLGGLIGYWIGYAVFETLGMAILQTLNLEQAFEVVSQKFQDHAGLAVFAAAFTPIPFKVFTIAAGVCKISLPVFLLASIIGRSLRFFMVATALYWFGPVIREKIEQHFNVLTLIFTFLLMAGLLVLK
jgi:membrane protein YqaA with SNARE-associated domain